ncbi:MAG: hypothetical protein IT318_05040 [Anaerolineales bacterium]|nr:hypothetical protein [Anaerolineales bacterium]
METTVNVASSARGPRPRTSLIFIPLLAALLGLFAWGLAKLLAPMMLAEALKVTYREADEAFYAEVDAFYAQNDTVDGAVVVPPGQTGYLLAQQWAYLPMLRLKAGTPYTFWVASADVPHGFTLRDQGLNFMLIPGYAYEVELRFDTPGRFAVSCTEYCGLGHEAMFGQIVVEP